ncbi:hypothetical protein [Ancylomarina longa]|uniref:Uncharacterized protein n=1 Tax=Ancylomarina longa TaxID=2487017 RepID=A0A434AWG7_9BACT|nr:hypothetical protein [Ancylomarina longa]RUT78861.1 hypothetical protein DLK05_06940 [Ancylomarina longa]
MKRILLALYTLATILIIVGALFILQGDSYGSALLIGGLVLNIFYRLLTFDFPQLKVFKVKSIFKLASIFLMMVACILFFTNSDQKFNLLIVSILSDTFLNFKEISFKKK